MKKLLTILSAAAALTASTHAEITTYAEYHLGEDGLDDFPRDGSGNLRHFTDSAGIASTVDTVGVVATASTAYIRSQGNGGWFRAPFAALPSDNLAAGIYVQAASTDAANHGHIFTLGNIAGSFRVSLTADGWVANVQIDPREDPGTPIGDPAALIPDTWTHLSIIRLNGSTGFYVNGVLSGAVDVTSIPVHTDNGHLIVNPGGAAYFDGLIDEFRVLSFTTDETEANIIAALEGIDSDMDGLFDDFEQRIIDADPVDLIVTIADVLPEDDFDGDMATNLREMNAATDPTDPLDIPIFDTDMDGMDDQFEQMIIDADLGDAINTLADVLPEDDFDGDLYTNAEEEEAESDPTDPLSPNPADITVDFEMIAFWDFNDSAAGALTTVDRVGEYPGTLGTIDGSEASFTPDMGGRTGSAGDYGMDFGNDPAGARNVIVSDQTFLDAVNASTAQDRLSVSFWQKNVATGNASSFDFTSDVTTRAMHGHIPWSSGQVFFDHQTSVENRDRENTAVTNDWFTWTHIAVVKGRRVKQLWIDGVRVINKPVHNPGMGTMTELAIGSGADGGNSVQAVIDDFAIFNDALTPEQIAELAGGASPFSLVGGEPSFTITEYSRVGDIVTLTWESAPGETYAVKYSTDLTDWGSDLDDGIQPEAGSDTTTESFDLSVFEIEDLPRLYFRIEK